MIHDVKDTAQVVCTLGKVLLNTATRVAISVPTEPSSGVCPRELLVAGHIWGRIGDPRRSALRNSSRVGGGVLARWPPSASQTARTPYSASPPPYADFLSVQPGLWPLLIFTEA
jgi:hypothetical protein